MKISKLYIFIIISILFSSQNNCIAQEESAGKPVLKLQYFNNSGVQYLIIDSKLKKNKVLTPQKNITYELYLDSSTTSNLIGKVTTDEDGKAKSFLPVSLKSAWDASPNHTFIVKLGEDEVISDYSITKTMMTIDTSADGDRLINVNLKKFDGKNWVPVPDAEMKVGVDCVGGVLSAGDNPTYTTDSEGNISAEFKRENLPGDPKGNIKIVAKLEGNEEFGNVIAQKEAHWGVPQILDNDFFNKRTLWATRYRTPIWLLAMAYSIIIGVWGTLIYLVFEIVKIKKIGVSK